MQWRRRWRDLPAVRGGARSPVAVPAHRAGAQFVPIAVLAALRETAIKPIKQKVLYYFV